MNTDTQILGHAIDNLYIGKVIEVDGSRLIAELDSSINELSRVYAGDIYPIGQFGSIIKIHFGNRIIYGQVSRLRMKTDFDIERGIYVDTQSDERVIEAELFGEGEWTRDASGLKDLGFQRGLSTFPLPQQSVYLTSKDELRSIYSYQTRSSILIGEHVGSGGAPCFAELNDLLGKHTAVLGSTGSGKSGAVAAIIHSILNHGDQANHENWRPQVIILDPHDEYASAFKVARRLSTDEGSLSLPYWLLNLDETIGLFIGKSEFAATSQSNIVKNALLDVRLAAANAISRIDSTKITVDSPIPYSLGDPVGIDQFGEVNGDLYTEGLVGAINTQRPDNRNKSQHEDFNRVIRKIESLMKDERLSFMMDDWDDDEDSITDVFSQFVRNKLNICTIDLSGVPNEVAGTASAVVARMLFSLKVWQSTAERKSSPVLIVCEEAHRYVPNSGDAQYDAAQNAIKRIAKEGRKYGIGMILISQRPSEVESTVLSQCNSWFVLRMTNERDKSHVQNVLPDSMTGLTKMLSSLRRREAIFVGEATIMPSRILIQELQQDELPRSNDIDFHEGWQHLELSRELLDLVAMRWRHQQKSKEETTNNL